MSRRMLFAPLWALFLLTGAQRMPAQSVAFTFDDGPKLESTPRLSPQARNEAMLARDPRANMLYANLRQKRPEARAAMRQRAAEFFAGDEMTPNAFLSRAEVEE